MAHQYTAGDEPVPGSGYRLVDFLGRGGFGEVWKASAPGGAEAALKIIRLGGWEGRKEFRALQLVKRIRHPNLVPIIAFWLKGDDGSILDDSLAMQGDLPTAETSSPVARATMNVPLQLSGVQAAELIIAMGLGDQSLIDRLKECQAAGLEGIPDVELLGYMESSAEAIDFLNRPIHNLGSGPVAIQHCDIKPHNLMIVGGAAQVCDFGLARSLAADRTNTAAASIAYAAPECLVEGKPSATTDQYALAITYFELKTGRLPYRNETLAAIMDAKSEGKLDFAPLSEDEAIVLRRATSRAPEQRYPAALEMVQHLRRAVLGEDFVARPPAKRTSLLAIVLVGLVVLLALAAVVASGIWPGRTPQVVRPSETGGNSETEAPADPAVAALQRAAGHAGQGESGLAIEDYTQALQLRSNYGEALLGRGRCYLKAGQTDAAIADFRALDSTRPEVRGELAQAYFQRAEGLVQKQDFAAAVADYEEVLKLEPKFGKALLGRGRCHVKRQEYDEAIADLEEARRWIDVPMDASSAEFAEAYLNRGTRSLKQRDYPSAVADLEQAAKLRPSDARIFSRLAAAWFSQKKFEQAIEQATVAIGLDPNDDTDFFSRGRAHRELGQLDKAIADFSSAIALNPQNAAAYAARGDAYGEREDVKRSLADFDRAIQLCSTQTAPNFPLANAYMLRASARLIAGQLDQAAADFDEVLSRGTPQDRASIHGLLDSLAEAYADEQNFTQAAKWIKAAVELAPDESAKQDYRAKLERYEAGKP